MPSAIVPRWSGKPMCGHRLSTAWTASPSAKRQSVLPSTWTTRRPASRSSESEAARTKVSAAMALMVPPVVDVTRTLEPQVRLKSSGERRAHDRRAGEAQRRERLGAPLLRPVDAQAGRVRPGRQGRRNPAEPDPRGARDAARESNPEPPRLGAAVE